MTKNNIFNEIHWVCLCTDRLGNKMISLSYLSFCQNFCIFGQNFRIFYQVYGINMKKNQYFVQYFKILEHTISCKIKWFNNHFSLLHPNKKKIYFCICSINKLKQLLHLILLLFQSMNILISFWIIYL